MTKYVISVVTEDKKYYYAGGTGMSSGGTLTLTIDLENAVKFNSHGAAIQAGLTVEFDLKALGRYEGAKVLCEELSIVETIWDRIKQMSKEEFAEWLFANCEYISAEYGACSGEANKSGIVRLLDSAAEGDW